MISAAFPYKKQRRRVLGRQMAYVDVGAGDPIDLVPTDEHAISVAEVVTLYTADADSRELLQRAVRTAALPQAWRDYFRTRIWEADS